MGKSDVISEPSVTFARNVDWNLFKVFHEIARRGGIGAAARALNRKQPSITAALRRLEDQVGATLCTKACRRRFEIFRERFPPAARRFQARSRCACCRTYTISAC